MKFLKRSLLPILLTTAASAWACDLCGCYTPRIEVTTPAPFTFYASVAEQFTHFGTDRLDGREVANPTGQYLDSSNTQLVAGVRLLGGRLGFQLGVPLIYRAYQRPAGFDIERGRVSGLGDISLLASLVVFQRQPLIACTRSEDGKTFTLAAIPEPRFSANVSVIAGVKMPTGDSSRIREEFAESEVEGAPPSGIHGHDLALGTGSWDGVFGVQASARYRAVFFQGEVQFTLRGPSHYTYHFANDLAWNGGPGVYFVRDEKRSLALQCVVSGESKNTDVFRGQPAYDTGVTALYVGPRVLARFGRFSAEAGVDLPVLMHTTDFQTTPDHRIRAALSVQF